MRFFKLAVLVVLSACGEAPAPEQTAERDTTTQADTATAVRDVVVYFSRGEEVAPVSRTVAGSGDVLALALRELLKGPTEAETGAGITSWFSNATASTLQAVAVDTAGVAIVDFADLRAVIPNASSSAGSAALLRELNATVFEHDAVRSIEYRMNGSCEEFWNWLQYGCQQVKRN